MSERQIEINSDQLVRIVANAAVGDGLVPDGMYDFVAERGDKQIIIVAAAPRTGSTYLTNVLSELTGLPWARLCSGYSTNEHDLYLPALCIFNKTGCVSQLHAKGTFHNAALMKAFGIKPITTWVFSEPISTMQIVGMAIVVAGTVVSSGTLFPRKPTSLQSGT